MRHIVKLLALVLNAICVVSYILGCLTVYVAPDKFSGLTFFGTIFPILLVLNAFFLLFWILVRKWVLAGLLIFLFLATFHSIRGVFQIPFAVHEASDDESQLSLLTYNISNFNAFREVDALCNYIFEQNADIVCLQEFAIRYKGDKSDPDKIIERFEEHYPYHMLWYKNQMGPHWWGVAIFSKYPLINKHKVEYESLYNVSVQTDILFENDTIRLFNNHLESNKLTLSDMKQFTEWQDGKSEKNLFSITGWLTGKLSSASTIRAAQARVLRDSIKASPYPVIVCGDFNDVPQSYTYHLVSNNLRDVLYDVGSFGYAYTYHHHGMYVRIDQVLISEKLLPISAVIDRPDYSDHYPIKAEICVLQ